MSVTHRTPPCAAPAGAGPKNAAPPSAARWAILSRPARRDWCSDWNWTTAGTGTRLELGHGWNWDTAGTGTRLELDHYWNWTTDWIAAESTLKEDRACLIRKHCRIIEAKRNPSAYRGLSIFGANAV